MLRWAKISGYQERFFFYKSNEMLHDEVNGLSGTHGSNISIFLYTAKTLWLSVTQSFALSRSRWPLHPSILTSMLPLLPPTPISIKKMNPIIRLQVTSYQMWCRAKYNSWEIGMSPTCLISDVQPETDNANVAVIKLIASNVSWLIKGELPFVVLWHRKN